jgi:hypothetical protein
MVVLGAATLPCRRQVTRAFAENGADQKAVRVRFEVRQRVKYGQHVAIVGSNPALGAWDPTKSVSLHWSAGDVWRSSAAVEVPPGEVELKFVVVDGERVQWQAGDNVKVPCTAPEVVVKAEGLNGGGVKIKTNGALKTAEKEAEDVKKVDAVKEIKTTVASSNGAVVEKAAAPAPVRAAAAVAAAPAKLDKLTVVQLKDKAKALGVSTTGKKADLVARIQAALE